MKKLPFYEVKTIRGAENDDCKRVIILADGRWMIYEFVPRNTYRAIRERGDEEIIGYLTRGDDSERVYTIYEIICLPGQYITPGFHPPRNDS